MSKQRYPEEFNIEAVKLIIERGHKVADVAARLEQASTACTSGSKCVERRLASARLNCLKPTSCVA